MPTYQYVCTECGGQLEAVQKFTDDPLTVHEDCGGRLRKVFSPVGIVFKGSGFYRTDSRSSGSSATRRRPPSRRRSTDRGPRTSGSRTALQGERSTESVVVSSSGSLRPSSAAEWPRPRAASSLRQLLGREGRLSRHGRGRGHRGHRRVGVLRVPDRRRGGAGRDPVRRAERGGARRRGRAAAGWPSCRGTASDHRFPPHKIPYRANLWALRALGVRRILAPSAVGSLTTSYGPGTLVVPDQLVDRTTGRVQTLLRRVRGARAVRRPVLPVGPGARDRSRAAGGLGAGRVGHARGHRRPAVLHPRGVAVVRRAGLDADRDDRAPRGGARPRAGPLLHDAGAGHRHRRRRRGGRRGDPGRGVRGLRQEHHAGSASWWRRSSRPFPAEREDDLCAHALDGIRLPIDLP